MDNQKIYQVLLEQKEELASYTDNNLVHRREEKLLNYNSRLAQVVIGVRRSGKSTMCHMGLQSNNINYGYVNFDDDRFASLKIDNLNDVLEGLYRIYGTEIRHLFFDEIQNIEGWHLFVNRLLRQGFKIVVTGSNAKLLSVELATHLTGRYNEIRLYPFSFKEYCLFRKVSIDIPTTKNISLLKNVFQDYLIEGGFPELDEITNRHAYVEGIINTIVTKDIKTRFKLKNADGLKMLANHLINNVGQTINIASISDSLGVGTAKTVRNYVDYLSQAFLILPLNKFSYKSHERLRNEKSYVIDTGIITYRHNALSSENLGWRLENMVRLELLRRTNPDFQDIYYYRPNSHEKEVDFVMTQHGKVIELIQVSFDISAHKTFKRETSALIDASKRLQCDNLTLIALSDTRTEYINDKKINVIDAYEWFLGV